MWKVSACSQTSGRKPNACGEFLGPQRSEGGNKDGLLPACLLMASSLPPPHPLTTEPAGHAGVRCAGCRCCGADSSGTAQHVCVPAAGALPPGSGSRIHLAFVHLSISPDPATLVPRLLQRRSAANTVSETTSRRVDNLLLEEQYGRSAETEAACATADSDEEERSLFASGSRKRRQPPSNAFIPSPG